MSEKELIFYKKPFGITRFGAHVYDSAGNFVFQFERKYDEKGRHVSGQLEMEDMVIESLNSETLKPMTNLQLTYDGGMIFNEGEPFILIRGWGNLTGIGGHSLSAEKAAKIQDDFRDWIIYKLSAK